VAEVDDLATALFAAATARLEEAHDAAVAGQPPGCPMAAVRDNAEAVSGKCADSADPAQIMECCGRYPASR